MFIYFPHVLVDETAVGLFYNEGDPSDDVPYWRSAGITTPGAEMLCSRLAPFNSTALKHCTKFSAGLFTQEDCTVPVGISCDVC